MKHLSFSDGLARSLPIPSLLFFRLHRLSSSFLSLFSSLLPVVVVALYGEGFDAACLAPANEEWLGQEADGWRRGVEGGVAVRGGWPQRARAVAGVGRAVGVSGSRTAAFTSFTPTPFHGLADGGREEGGAGDERDESVTRGGRVG